MDGSVGVTGSSGPRYQKGHTPEIKLPMHTKLGIAGVSLGAGLLVGGLALYLARYQVLALAVARRATLIERWGIAGGVALVAGVAGAMLAARGLNGTWGRSKRRELRDVARRKARRTAETGEAVQAFEKLAKAKEKLATADGSERERLEDQVQELQSQDPSVKVAAVAGHLAAAGDEENLRRLPEIDAGRVMDEGKGDAFAAAFHAHAQMQEQELWKELIADPWKDLPDSERLTNWKRIMEEIARERQYQPVVGEEESCPVSFDVASALPMMGARAAALKMFNELMRAVPNDEMRYENLKRIAKEIAKHEGDYRPVIKEGAPKQFKKDDQSEKRTVPSFLRRLVQRLLQERITELNEQA